MLLLGPDRFTEDYVWTARADVRAEADDVLLALTDPAAIASWAPVDFEIDGLAGGRLQAGSRERVTGAIAGLRVAFDVEVARADTRRLELVAHGPVSFDVVYRFREDPSGVHVKASVSLHRRHGVTARLLRTAVSALLDAGILATALQRLATGLSAGLEQPYLTRA